MRRFSLSLALLLLTPGAQAANLGEIYQLARKHDPLYAAALSAHTAGLEKLPQGQALLRPNVNLAANLRHNERDSSSAGNDSDDSRALTLTLTQPLYRAQNRESLEQARLQVALADAQLAAAGQELFLRVARAYFDVLLAQDTLATARSQKAAFAAQLALAKKSFEVGAATIVDTHEAQARHDATVAEEVAAENELEVRRRALERLILSETPPLAVLREGAGTPLPEPAEMQHWVQAAEANNSAVVVAGIAESIAAREIARQRAGHRPTLDLAATYADSRNASVGGLGTVDSRSGTLGVEFAWSLYQGGAQDSRIREAVANHERARFELDAARRQAALEARQAFLGVISGDARVKALEQAVRSSETQLKSTKLGLEVGVRTAVDVLNAEQQLHSARRDLAGARYAALVSGLSLRAAAGRLAESDLEALDALLR